MKTGKRLLAMLLVLAMLVSNLPVGAIAAEYEELLPESTEALTETEQSEPAETTEAPETQAPAAETTEAPETEAPTAAPETEAPTEAPETEPAETVDVEQEQSVREEAVNETVPEYPAFLTVAPVWEDEDGDLYVPGDQFTQDYVNPYGREDRVAFFLNEFDGENWIATSVEVQALDDSIRLELGEEYVRGAEVYYHIFTDKGNTTSGVAYDDVTMNIGTWPHHFHFTTQANTDNSNTGLIYELDADHLTHDTDYVTIYAAMFHGDFAWSNVALSNYSDSFADIDYVSDDLYRITLYGEARKYVMDNGIVYLEVTGTAADLASGEVSDTYLSIPVFLAPNPGLIAVNLADDGDGLFYETENHSYMFRVVPGNVVHQMYYLRQWDYTLGEMTVTPVPVEDLRSAGDLTFTQMDAGMIRAGEPNGEYFTMVTTGTWGQSTYVYVELDNGRIASGVNAYTDMGGMAFFSQPVMDEQYYLREFQASTDRENVFYFIADENYSWDPFTIDAPAVLAEDCSDWADLEDLGNGVYKITLRDETVEALCRNDSRWLVLHITITKKDTGFTDVFYTGLNLTADPESILPYMTYGWLDADEDGMFEDEWIDNTRFDIIPGDSHCHIYYVHVWDAEQECYVSYPVSAEELYCDDDSFSITKMDEEECRPGEPNADCFVWVSAEEWGHEAEIYTYVDGVRAVGVPITTYLPEVGFYSEDRMDYDTFIQSYTVNPDAEENTFYVGLNTEEWVISGEPYVMEEGSLYDLEVLSDSMIRVTLNQEGIDRTLNGEDLWPTVVFDIRNTVDENWISTMYAGGICIRAMPQPYVSYSWLVGDDSGLHEDEWYDETHISMTPGDGFLHIYYLHIWDETQGEYSRTAIAAEDLYCDDESFTISHYTEGVREGEPNAHAFVMVSASEWERETEIYTLLDGVRVRGAYITTFLPEIGFYSSGDMSYETYIQSFVADPEAEENAFYLGIMADHFSFDGDPWIETEYDAERFSLEVVSEKLIKVTLTEAGLESVLNGEELWPTISFNVLYEDGTTDSNWSYGFYVRADAEDVVPQDQGLRFRFLWNDGDGFYDPGHDEVFGTNLAKGDVYSMIFFLKLWDDAQGQYIEIPVHPEHSAGITLNRAEAREGEENSEYFYYVSVTEFDKEMEVWAEYEGESYSMPIHSYLHTFGIYSGMVPSHDNRIQGPVDMDPFGDNTVYAAVMQEGWSVEDIYAAEWCSEYVDLEPVADNIWAVQLNQAGIEENMNQWHLEIVVCADIRNDQDPGCTEHHEYPVTFSREALEVKGFFQLDTGNYEIIEGGYIRSWPTGEFDQDEEGNSWEIWDTEVVEDLPDGLTYDYNTNTLTMEDYSGGWMSFEYECRDWETGDVWYNMPTDTLTVEVLGDNSLIAENAHAFRTYGGLNVCFVGDGSLDIRTDNNYGREDGMARVYDTMQIHDGATMTVDGPDVTVAAAGEGDEAIWDEEDYTGLDLPGHIVALNLNGGELYLESGSLTIEVPDGAGRNGEPIREGEPGYEYNETPGGHEGLVGCLNLTVRDGVLILPHLGLDSWYDESGNWVAGCLTMTGGEIRIEGQHWYGINEEGDIHRHYEGLYLGEDCVADLSGGRLQISLEAEGSSTYYEAICVDGGTLNISDGAEVAVEASNEHGQLLRVSTRFDENGVRRAGELNISGGVLDVSGSEGNGRFGIYMDHETVFTVSGGELYSGYADIETNGHTRISGGTITIGGQYPEADPEMFWNSGFIAGGPSFLIEGGTINVEDGVFDACGMVTMTGGEIRITNGSLKVNTGFAFDDGNIFITGNGNDMYATGHRWPALWVNGYMSVGGSGEGKAPCLYIEHDIAADAVIVTGTYHQMDGSTVTIVYSDSENAAVHVMTQFGDNGEPLIATDENGDPILDDAGNPIFLTGTFLMNDGDLNIKNPGDWDADLNLGMVVDPHSFAQFLGGNTLMNTTRLMWSGEVHIGGEAMVDVRDAAVVANEGHLVIDGGTLLATEESAVMLGMSEMNGGRMELNNGMILINGGFQFNNGEIEIINISDSIDPERVFTSLAVNTYFGIGDPEDPDSNPSLIIHNSVAIPAIQLNGTMHLMAGTVDINLPVTGNPGIFVNGPIFENGESIKTDDQGQPLGGEYLQNGGVMNINAAEEESIAGINGAEASVIFMNGGEMNLNGTNLVHCGQLFLYDTAKMNVTDGIVRLYDTAIAEIDGGTLTLNTEVFRADDVPSAFYADPGSQLILNSGEVSITSGAAGHEVAMQLDGTFRMEDGSLLIQAPGTGLLLNDSADIYGGSVEILVDGVLLSDGVLVAAGLQTGENADAALRIHGGEHFFTVPQGGQHDAVCYALNSRGMPVEVLGGTVHLDGQYAFFGRTADGADTLILPEDMVFYSLNTGARPQLLNYSLGEIVVQMYENDNVPGDWDTGEGFDFVTGALITTNASGDHTTWEVNDGILTFGGSGTMYDYPAAAPWVWLCEFITAAELDSNLTYIGQNAFAGLDNLEELIFLGNAPEIAENAFEGITAQALYPVGFNGWTTEKLQDYGGDITWLLNHTSVEVTEILTEKEVLFPGQSATLTVLMQPDGENMPNVVWTLEETPFATMTVKNNVATVTAKTVTETQTVTVYAVAEDGLAAPAAKVLTIYPKAQAVLLFSGDTEVTGGKLTFDLVTGSELKLTAALNPDDAEAWLDPAVTWSSSAEKVAAVDEFGTVTFTGTPGTVKITATAADGSGKKATVTITAKELIQDIEVAADTPDELVGGKSLTITVLDSDTGEKIKAAQIGWSIPEEFAPYAAVSAKGKLTTKVVAEPVDITVCMESLENPDAAVTHVITLRPAVTSLRIGQAGEDVTGDTIYVDIDGCDADNLPTLTLDAQTYPDGAFGDVTWKSSSTGIAKVEDGVVTGVWNSKTGNAKTGTVTITATAVDGSKKSASVKLNFGIFAQDVEITTTQTEILGGSSLTLTAKTFPENPTKAGITWSLKDSADKNYLSVTAAGKVKAKTVYAPTDVVLVATSKDGCASAEMTLRVMPKDMGMLVIRAGEEYVTKTTQTLDLNGNPTITLSAHTLNGGQEKVTWTPATSKLGTLTENPDGTLTVTLSKAGSVTVNANAADGRTASVTLKAAALITGITVIRKGGTGEDLVLASGKTMTMQAVLSGVTKGSVTWSVKPEGAATITSAGKLTAPAGLVEETGITVTATAADGSGISGSVDVTLVPQVQVIQIHDENGDVTNTTLIHDMAEQTQLQLTALTFPEDAADGVTWKSSSAKVATVDATGKITCLKAGTATITATASDDSGKKATFKLTVVKLVKDLTLAETAVVAGGKSLTLKADAGDATNKTVTWSMTGDTAYATLSAKGVLKTSAVTAPKTVYVTATANDGSGKTATCAVTIYPATTSVQVVRGDEVVTGKTVEVAVGRTITLEGISLPDNAANAYTWKSSGAAAKVEDGVVTGVTAGKTVTITCTAADGTGKKATVKVTVVAAPASTEEISLWVYPIGMWSDPDTVGAMMAEFEADTGIQVNVRYLTYTDGDVMVDTAIEAGAAPDLIMEGPERLVAKWGARGCMVNIADLFDTQDRSQIHPNVLAACFADANTAYQYPLTMTAHSMAINKTVFEAAGAMQYIDQETHTWNSTEDFFAAVEAVYEYTGTYVGAVYCGGQGGDQGTRALVTNLYGGTYTNAAHTAYTWDSQENIRALKALYDCKGILYDSSIAGGDEIALFYNGRLNMAFCWNIVQQQNPANAGTGAGRTADGDEILFLSFPAPEGQTPQLQGGIWGFGIFDNGNEEKIAAAKEFIRYFCDSDATAEAVKAAGYFPVRSVSGTWTEDPIVAEYNVLMPLLGDYCQVTDNWAMARSSWWNMLQEIAASSGSAEEIRQIVEEWLDQANNG